MRSALRADLARDLSNLVQQDRLRACPPFHGADRVHVRSPEAPLLSFSSNDYLGLANHPSLTEAAASSARRSGFGASASRLVSGDLPEHRDLEVRLSAFLGTEATLLFPSGYQANLGVLTSLAGPDDLIVSDALNHASLIDGCRLSRARVLVYPHANANAARAHLATPGPYRRRLLVTESIFSMDGDEAPLAELAHACAANDAVLVVDEAHALGVLGPSGTGLCRAAGVVPDVLVGTLGKAFGASGGFVSGVHELRDWLVNRARTFIFTTACPPPVAAAAAAALDIITGADGERRRADLRDRIALLRTLLGRPEGTSPILPLVLGPDAAALRAAAWLRERGFHVQPIRPPTVPAGTARLRVTLSAAHTEAEVRSLAAALLTLPSP